MRLYQLFFGFIFSFLCAAPALWATHSPTSHLSHECVNDSQYIVTLHFYRHCAGLICLPTETITISSLSGATAFNYALPLISTQDVTPNCPGDSSDCNTGFLPGLEMGTYRDTITLPGNYSDWHLVYNTCCRQNDISSFSNPGSEEYYVYTNIDNQTVTCNQTPSWNEDINVYACVGQDFIYNPMPVDPDSDSLVLSLVNPLSNSGNSISWSAGFTASNPFSSSTPIYFNSQTGLLQGNPSAMGHFVINYNVDEYRNGFKIASTNREVHLVVLNCMNNAPNMTVSVFSGGTMSNDTVHACGDDVLLFDVHGGDLADGDSIIWGPTNGDFFLQGTTLFVFPISNPDSTRFLYGGNIPNVDTTFDIYLSVFDDACFYTQGQTFKRLTIVAHNSALALNPTTIDLCQGDTAILDVHDQYDPYPGATYSWSTGETTSSIAVSVPGTVTLDVTDACATKTIPYNIVVHTLPTAATANDTIISAGNGVQLMGTASGGTAPYDYNWTPPTGLSCTDCADPLATPNQSTLYDFLVWDAYGCSDSDSIWVQLAGLSIDTINAGFVALGDSLNNCVSLDAGMVNITSMTAICGPNNGTFAQTQDSCFQYIGTTEGYDTVCILACDGPICDTTIFIVQGASCVWAGDTDTSKLVNHMDLLPWGLGFGQTGTMRPNADLSLDCEPSLDWVNSTPVTSVNYKHSDTDGDGLVGLSDTAAIILNWGQLHLKEQRQSSGTIPFYIEPTIAQPSEVIQVPIILGDTTDPAIDAYGVAFTVNYNQIMVEPNTASVDFSTSWLGSINSDVYSISKDFYVSGEIEVALTRVDGIPQTGMGQLGTLQLTIKDDILRKAEERLDVSVSNVRLITHQELELFTDNQPTEILITDSLLAVNEIVAATENIRIYPNPTQGNFQIESQEKELSKIVIFDAVGRELFRLAPQSQLATINPSRWEAGIYIIQIYTESEIYSRKLILRP